MSKKYDHFFRDLFRVKNTGTVQKYKNRLIKICFVIPSPFSFFEEALLVLCVHSFIASLSLNFIFSIFHFIFWNVFFVTE